MKNKHYAFLFIHPAEHIIGELQARGIEVAEFKKEIWIENIDLFLEKNILLGRDDLKKIGDFFGIWHEVWENLQRTFCETVAYHFNRLD